MHNYNTILGVIELRLSKVSYDTVQKRYRIGRSGIALIMNRYNDSGLSLDDLRQMPASKVVDLIYPKENLRHKDIPLPDFEKIHEQMIQMGKHADLSFLWIDYKKEHPNGYQLAQFYKLYRDFMISMPPFHGCLYGKEVFRLHCLYRCWNDYSGPCQVLS